MNPNPKKYLEYYSHLYPSAWQQVDKFRAGRGKGLPFWPNWCFLPLAGAYSIVSSEAERQGMDITKPEHMLLVNDIGIIGALAAWRVTQGIYRFDPDVYAEIIKTPLSGDLPHQILFNLPEWCVYVETPDMVIGDKPLRGFFAYLEHDAADGRKELRFVLDHTPDISESPGLKSEVLHLGPWSLTEAISRKIGVAARAAQTLQTKVKGIDLLNKFKDAIAEGLSDHFAPLVSLLLYLCSANADITGNRDRRPGKPQAKKTKKGERLFPPHEVTMWDVGVRLGSALRQAKKSTLDDTATSAPSGRSSPRPHVRRAHWHLYWTGPRTKKQKPVTKWLPPVPVNVDSYEELPTVIREIKKKPNGKDGLR